jgi:hypothetical protein
VPVQYTHRGEHGANTTVHRLIAHAVKVEGPSNFGVGCTLRLERHGHDGATEQRRDSLAFMPLTGRSRRVLLAAGSARESNQGERKAHP